MIDISPCEMGQPFKALIPRQLSYDRSFPTWRCSVLVPVLSHCHLSDGHRKAQRFESCSQLHAVNQAIKRKGRPLCYRWLTLAIIAQISNNSLMLGS